MDNTQPAKAAGTLIYVVDDEPMLLELATVILEPLGYTVTGFTDPKDALGAFAAVSRRPDLLITDYAMHSMTGMQLIEDLRRLEPCQKILLVSGTVGEDVFEGTPCKPDRFLPKPYESREFLEVVDALLREKVTPARARPMDLRGKKLGLLLSAGPDCPTFSHCARLAETALGRGVEVYVYCLDEAVRGADDPRLLSLEKRGVRLFACAYALQRRDLPPAGPAGLSGLTMLGDIIAGTDRFLSFN